MLAYAMVHLRFEAASRRCLQKGYYEAFTMTLRGEGHGIAVNISERTLKLKEMLSGCYRIMNNTDLCNVRIGDGNKY
jgi:hypothetical protein